MNNDEMRELMENHDLGASEAQEVLDLRDELGVDDDGRIKVPGTLLAPVQRVHTCDRLEEEGTIAPRDNPNWN